MVQFRPERRCRRLQPHPASDDRGAQRRPPGHAAISRFTCSPTRFRGKPASRHIARNNTGETCSAAAFDRKIPQERAQAGRQFPDGSITAMARAVEEKAANSGRFPPLWCVPGVPPSSITRQAVERSRGRPERNLHVVGLHRLCLDTVPGTSDWSASTFHSGWIGNPGQV